ncbi:vegetative cell wall protein gp1-like, partial [Meleagris gallopavo]|uniref:vegetative cell wall protein gp1-like n=1 Tax=Meleagris gallopavo TaxID=9103 RepID=UPI00093E78F8
MPCSSCPQHPHPPFMLSKSPELQLCRKPQGEGCSWVLWGCHTPLRPHTIKSPTGCRCVHGGSPNPNSPNGTHGGPGPAPVPLLLLRLFCPHSPVPTRGPHTGLYPRVSPPRPARKPVLVSPAPSASCGIEPHAEPILLGPMAPLRSPATSLPPQQLPSHPRGLHHPDPHFNLSCPIPTTDPPNPIPAPLITPSIPASLGFPAPLALLHVTSPYPCFPTPSLHRLPPLLHLPQFIHRSTAPQAHPCPILPSHPYPHPTVVLPVPSLHPLPPLHHHPLPPNPFPPHCTLIPSHSSQPTSLFHTSITAPDLSASPTPNQGGGD